MPDRDYYLKTDEKSVALRAKYVTYLEQSINCSALLLRRLRAKRKR